jgi:endonuclease YncB( thermonuclease family)
MSLVGAALLIGLDRGVLAPYWSRQTTPSRPATAQDATRYHNRMFAVTKVVDGDTLHIDAPDMSGSSTKVRLLGIDAPELGHRGVAQMYFATEATDYARQLAQGVTVTIYLDADGPSRGKYGRLLAYIEMPDGRFLNELLVSEGYAYADSRFAHSYYHRYKQLEASARALKKGLWATITPEQMPSWHRRPSSQQRQE